jgi:hypothetical protein
MDKNESSGLVLLPRTEDNMYSKLEAAKNHVVSILENIMKEILVEQELPIELTHSNPYSGSNWVQVRALISEGELQRRITLQVTLVGHEFHRYPIEYWIKFQDNDKIKWITGFYSIAEDELRKILNSLIKGVSLSSIKSQINLPRFRTRSFQFWRPKNKIESISKFNWAIIFFVIGFIALSFGNVGGVMIGSILILVGVIIQLIDFFEERYIITSGKPFSEPRNLKLIDSWQAVIFDLGSQSQKIRDELITKLKSSLMKGANLQEERIWHWGLDGKIEKKQIVITNNRGLAYLHIYPYGKDLYVGWDAHMNYGQWVEGEVASGRDKKTGQLVMLESISPGWQGVNEYDVQDAISLGEWCHAKLVKTVKVIMKEHKIDQEIDFTIIRENRSGLISRTQQKEGKKKGKFFEFKRKQ